MIARITQALRKAPLLSAAFAIALGATLWFGGQTIARAIYWSDPRHQNQQIAGWMTLGYIGRSWQVPSEELRNALNSALPGDMQGRLPPIEKLARETGLSQDEIIAILQTAITDYRATVPDQK